MHIPDYSTQLYFPIDDGRQYMSIGWLGDRVTSVGSVPDDVVAALEILSEVQNLSDGTLGMHTCELCHQHESHGSFWVGLNDARRALMPTMISHYIREHGYALPREIQVAVLRDYQRLPTPVISFLVDRLLLEQGMTPVGTDGNALLVRGDTSAHGDFLSDLQFITGKKVRVVP